MKNAQNAVIFAVPVALLALSGAFCGGRQPEQPRREAARPSDNRVKILQFYSAAGAVEPGGKALLCYGVENAASVRIVPNVEPVKPALNRCLEVAPARTTQYTLTAEAPGQAPATASLTVQVKRGGAPPPPSATGPRIVSFRLGEKRDGVTLLCYEVEGAEAVSVEPRALPRTSALRGCFGVAQNAGVTYTLRAYGPNGQTVRQALTPP
jgi:hypothetical protein